MSNKKYKITEQQLQQAKNILGNSIVECTKCQKKSYNQTGGFILGQDNNPYYYCNDCLQIELKNKEKK